MNKKICLNWTKKCDLEGCDKKDKKCPSYLCQDDFKDEWETQRNPYANWGRDKDD
jgi:hypothetical protein